MVVAEPSAARQTTLPVRLPVAGVLVSRTDYAEATRTIVEAARDGRELLVAATSVHGIGLALRHPAFMTTLNSFDLVTPDGQPVRWALNLLHHTGLAERVYGPTLTLRVCQAAADAGLGVYFYGSRPDVLERLQQRLRARIPRLIIAGAYSPPFRSLSASEDDADAARISASGAKLVFVGLGCPRQEVWAVQHRARLGIPLVCVGAAFDFHAGTLRQAPAWMQARGLEWLFRVAMEPRRLWRRYAANIPVFVTAVAAQLMTERLGQLSARRRLPLEDF